MNATNVRHLSPTDQPQPCSLRTYSHYELLISPSLGHVFDRSAKTRLVGRDKVSIHVLLQAMPHHTHVRNSEVEARTAASLNIFQKNGFQRGGITLPTLPNVFGSRYQTRCAAS
jgi:hypothetical protein